MAAGSKELPPTAGNAAASDDDVMSTIYAAVKKISVVGAIYFVGYMGWSVAWLITPVIFSVIRDQWKRSAESKRSISMACAMASEKDVILAKITDLPSWVRYSFFSWDTFICKYQQKEPSCLGL